MTGLRIAALVKQIPRFEAMELGPDGRLVREGLELEMNAYCRRAVARACGLAGASGSVTVITLGPPAAEDCVREAVAWGLDRGVEIDGVVVSDPAFAGSDTLATARALAAAIHRTGPFDLVMMGRNSVDADTGQVPPQLAELVDLPFLTGVKRIDLVDGRLLAGCEHDDGWVEAELTLPAVVSCAERLCDPCKMPPDRRAAVPADRLATLTATDLGPGPWGDAGSPTRVGTVRTLDSTRLRKRLEGDVDTQVAEAVALLRERGALAAGGYGAAPAELVNPGGDRDLVVLAEPGRDNLTAELLAAATRLGGRVVALGPELEHRDDLGSLGADRVVALGCANVEDDVAGAAGEWVDAVEPWAVLAPSTAWGREVAARIAARTGSGLTGDAVDLAQDGDRLVAWKPAFGGALVAAITARSPVQMVTVRAGVLPPPVPRVGVVAPVETVAVTPRGRVVVTTRTREDDVDTLAKAEVVIGVGQGVDPADYPALRPLADVLDAEIGATRKVTDRGWMPHARQIGITGRSIAPRLFVSVGASGKFNHMVGVRAAATVLAVNPDPDAPVWEFTDVGITADWRSALPLLVSALSAPA